MWIGQLRRQARCAAEACAIRWWREPLRWLAEWRRRRLWIRTGVQLEQLRRRAIDATGDQARTAAIDAANAVFAELKDAMGVAQMTSFFLKAG